MQIVPADHGTSHKLFEQYDGEIVLPPHSAIVRVDHNIDIYKLNAHADLPEST
jgi:hypothetical protein